MIGGVGSLVGRRRRISMRITSRWVWTRSMLRWVSNWWILLRRSLRRIWKSILLIWWRWIYLLWIVTRVGCRRCRWIRHHKPGHIYVCEVILNTAMIRLDTHPAAAVLAPLLSVGHESLGSLYQFMLGHVDNKQVICTVQSCTVVYCVV